MQSCGPPGIEFETNVIEDSLGERASQLRCLKSQLTLFIIFTFIKGLSENVPPVLARIPLLPSPQTANQL